jgi:putative redox protein
MQAKVIWSQRLSFSGTADTGFSLPLGAKPQVGGDNDGFRPMELIALGMAGCTAMDVISILQKKRQEITSFEVIVNGQRADEHPRVFTHIDIEYRIRGVDVDEAAVKRAIELSETKYCPAQAMLGDVVPIELKYTIESD